MTIQKVLFAFALAVALSGVPSFAQCAQSPLAGHWVANDPNTRGVTRAEIGVGCCDQILNGVPVCSPPDSVHLFGKCHPNDCDWGAQSGHFQNGSGNQLNLSLNQGFVVRTINIRRSGALLRLRIASHYTDHSGRPDRTSIEFLKR